MKIELTKAGADYMVKCLDGRITTGTVFSGISLGAAEESAGKDATELGLFKTKLNMDDMVRQDEYVTLTGRLSNGNIDESFYATEIGVFIKDPDNENAEIMFAYGYMPKDSAILIPASSEYAFETVQTILIYVGAMENISAELNESMNYATQADLKEHTQNKGNPHKVTAEQVGLGKVPNVSTDDQTPSFVEEKNLTNIKTGEKMKVLFGKIQKAITELIAHLSNKANPHGVTAAQAGAAEKTHSHSASEIKSGILGVERGGTGVSSYSALRQKMNLGSSSGPLEPAYGGTGVTSLGLLREKLGLGYGSDLLEPKYGGTGVKTYPELREKLGFGKQEGALGEKYGGTGVESYEKLRQALGLGASLKELGVTFGGTGVSSYVALREKLGLGKSSEALGVEFGGTGATNLDNLARSLWSCMMPYIFTYTGTGTADRVIDIGFTPACVIVMDSAGRAFTDDSTKYYGGIAYKSGNDIVNVTRIEDGGNINEWTSKFSVLGIVENGIKVNYYSANHIYSNTNGEAYVCIAFRNIPQEV